MPASVPLDLLGRRPDVVAARWRAEAARHAIDTAKAEFYPNINPTAFAGFQAMGTGNLLDAASRMAGIGPAISLPIFHGGALNANLAGRRADADLAVSDYNQSVLDAVRQVADALDGPRLLDQERGEQRQARAAIEAAYDLAVKRHKAGMGNYLSVLIAQTGVLTQARLDTDLRIRAYQLDADLAYARAAATHPPRPPPLTPSPARWRHHSLTDPDSDVMNAPATNPARKRLLLLATGAFVLIAIAYGIWWALFGAHFENTDDAYVHGWCRSRRRCPAPSSPSRPTTPKP